jgi:4-hydroxybutyrate CoA-transferase
MTTWTEQATTDWRELYARRRVGPEEAVALVKSGDRIYIPVGQRVGILIAALLGRAHELEDVEVKCLPTADYGWYDDAFRGHISVNVVFATLFSRAAVNRQQAEFTPWWVWGGHKALDEGRPEARPVDVVLISVTPPNRWGYCCLGNSLWDAKTTARRAKKVVAVVSEAIPHTYGDTWLHVSEIDAFVEHTEPPPEARWAYPEPDPWDRPIAEYVASLVKDRDTIQIGTGSTTGNIPRLGVLDGKHDLGYFGELTVPGTVELVQKGVITSRYLESHPGKFVTTTAGNSVEDLDFIDNNPTFEFYAVEYVHDPRVIGRHDNLVAINNALTVDLTGQIGAASIGPQIYSGTGGHLAYAMGAFLSRGGRYICVLPSTAVGGTVSRIVPQFAPGQIVTVPRDLADIVVTEYGIARLLNKTERERANELIAVAHPDFRAELRRAAERQWRE